MAWLLVVWLNIIVQLWLVIDTRDVKPQTENYVPDYGVYHNVSNTHKTLERLLIAHPHHMLLYKTFKSGEGRQIPVYRLPPDPVKVPTTVEESEKPKRVLMVFGEHAREFLPVESALFFLQRVLNNPNLSLSRLLRNHFDVYVVPLLNPDGRMRIEKSSNYCWRGTASGVDLSRNFPWEFGKGKNTHGSSSNHADEEYRGNAPFSEFESQAIRDLTFTLTFDAAISLHSGIRHIYTPFSDSLSRKTGRKPLFWKSMGFLASRMKVAMGSDPKHAFKAGPAAQLNDYASDGTMFDYLAGVRNVPVSLAVELWGSGDVGGVKCFDLFNPPSNQLMVELSRLIPLYEAFFSGLWALRANFTVRESSTQHRSSSVPPYPLITLLAIVVLVGGLLFKRHIRSSPTSWRLMASGRKRVVSLRSFSSRFSGFTSLKSV